MKRFCLVFIAACIAGCGGGGGGGGGSTPSPQPGGGGSGSGATGGGSGSGSGWVAGSFLPSQTFAAQCAAPRSGVDPATGMPYPDIQGSVLTENNWLRSWSNEIYLWYDEIVDRDPGQYTTADYFAQLKTFAATASGRPKDRFHFSMPTTQWNQLSQSGVDVGYGADWGMLSDAPPLNVVVAYVEPGSPAAAPPASLVRGDRVLNIDGVDVTATDTASVNNILEGLYPTRVGETHQFEILDPGASTPRSVVLVPSNVQSTPVQHVETIDTPSGGTVGYLLFNSHVATAEQPLIDAFQQFKDSGVTDLVLDLRYNSGGYLALASEVAYMIAGPQQTAGRTFEKEQFNDKYSATDPSGRPIEPLPFLGQAVVSGSGQALPSLGLQRVFVLTGSTTCSASESIINSLRGIDVEVIQIGTTTCGKPYGFYPKDNCGTTYFTIEVKGVNAKGFGDYADGFAPATAAGPIVGTPVEGCAVADDFTHALGDSGEARLAAALDYRDTQSCPADGLAPPGSFKPAAPSPVTHVYVRRSPALENRILGLP